MTTIPPQRPEIGDDIAPVFTACTALDNFPATGGRYVLYYKNGAGGAVSSIFAKSAEAAPKGTFPQPATGAADWADVRLSNGIPISTDAICTIPDVRPYIDSTGSVNLVHNGVAGPLTVAVIGPF